MKFTIPILILLFIAIVFISGCTSKTDDYNNKYVSPYVKYVNTTEYQQGYEKGVREQDDMQKRSEAEIVILHNSVNDSDMAFCYGYLKGQEYGAEQEQLKADQQAVANVRTNSTGYTIDMQKTSDGIEINFTANNTST